MYLGDNVFELISLTATTLPFYFATIEQYYTGELVLREIEGVDDGSLIYIGLALLTGYYGCDMWRTKFSFFGFPPI